MLERIWQRIGNLLSFPVVPENKAGRFQPPWWMLEKDLERIKKEVLRK